MFNKAYVQVAVFNILEVDINVFPLPTPPGKGYLFLHTLKGNRVGRKKKKPKKAQS